MRMILITPGIWKSFPRTVLGDTSYIGHSLLLQHTWNKPCPWRKDCFHIVVSNVSVQPPPFFSCDEEEHYGER